MRIDSIEVYFAKPDKRILYRPRFYSESLKCMVPISGSDALQETPQKAWAFAERWLGLV